MFLYALGSGLIASTTSSKVTLQGSNAIGSTISILLGVEVTTELLLPSSFADWKVAVSFPLAIFAGRISYSLSHQACFLRRTLYVSLIWIPGSGCQVKQTSLAAWAKARRLGRIVSMTTKVSLRRSTPLVALVQHWYTTGR